MSPQASQSSIELNLIENIELKEEVKRLKKDVIRLKGKEKAQPSQDRLGDGDGGGEHPAVRIGNSIGGGILCS